MKMKTFKRLEFSGVFSVFLFGYLLHNFNRYLGGSLLSVLFGSANTSDWEFIKVFLFSYILWGFVELCWIKPAFRQFAAAKVLSLYIITFLWFLCYWPFALCRVKTSLLFNCVFAFLLIGIGMVLSYNFTAGSADIRFLFIPCVFLLLLFFVCFVCFTPYPPRLSVFQDHLTGLYGVIPEHFDSGAATLDSLYGN